MVGLGTQVKSPDLERQDWSLVSLKVRGLEPGSFQYTLGVGRIPISWSQT